MSISKCIVRLKDHHDTDTVSLFTQNHYTKPSFAD
jgi:hypothetical protein